MGGPPCRHLNSFLAAITLRAPVWISSHCCCSPSLVLHWGRTFKTSVYMLLLQLYLECKCKMHKICINNVTKTQNVHMYWGRKKAHKAAHTNQKSRNIKTLWILHYLPWWISVIRSLWAASLDVDSSGMGRELTMKVNFVHNTIQ